MILYHGTSKENKEKILNEGFKMSYGEYGTCLYLAKDKQVAYDYGDEIIECFVDDEYIHTIDRSEVQDRLEIEYIAQKKGYSAICVTYNNVNSKEIDHSEICVFDLNIVEINK